jgi:hypothetical protein
VFEKTLLLVIVAAGCSRTGLDGTTAWSADAGSGDAAGDSAGEACPPAEWSKLSDTSKWSKFDVSSVDVPAKGFQGAVFDGRHLYFVPFFYDGAARGVVARFDTTASFDAHGAWTTFDLTTVSPRATGFCGAVFDGRYLYLVPFDDGSWDGVVARYDTSAAFDAPSAWTTFDLATVGSGVHGFAGAAFDGRWVYLAPYNGGTVWRLDTTLPFEGASSWSSFDLLALHAGRFAGASFDGRYVYFVPHDDGVVARYDTKSDFAAPASWATVDVLALTAAGSSGFQGAVFDGRYVYLAPLDSVVARYDTTAPFTSPGAWESFDAGALGRFGAAFDGRYVYFVPSDESVYYWLTFVPGSVVTRFDARTPPCLPPGWHASFF